MIIVDATVLADFFVGEGALKDSAESLAREDPDWASVSLWRYEFEILRKFPDVAVPMPGEKKG